MVALDLVRECPVRACVCSELREERRKKHVDVLMRLGQSAPAREDFDSCSMDTTTCFPKLEFRLRLCAVMRLP